MSALIAGAMLEGAGKAAVTLGGFAMQMQREFELLAQRKAERLEEIRALGEQRMQEIAAGGEEARKTQAAKLTAERDYVEQEADRNLRTADPALADKVGRIRSGKPNVVEQADESGGHSTAETLSQQEQERYDRARLTPAQRAEVKGREEDRAATADYRRETLAQGWAQIQRANEALRMQLERQDRATLTADARLEFDAVAKEFDKITGQVNELRKAMADPTAVGRKRESLQSDMDGLLPKLNGALERLQSIGIEARDRRAGAAPAGASAAPANRRPLSSFATPATPASK